MTELSSQDVSRLLEVVGELHRPGPLDDFPHRVMALVSCLVRSDWTAYNEVNLRRGRIVAFMEPNEPSAEEVAAWLQPHLASHPLISHLERTRGLTPLTISDFWSRRTYRHSAIYHDCFRRLGVEDQLALPFGPTPGVLLAVTLNRSRRTFSSRDRALLSALRPHLTQAYLTATQITHLQAEVSQRGALWDAMDCGALLVRPDGKIAFCSDRAARWLRGYCGTEALRRLDAPAVVRAWLHEHQTEPLNAQPLRITRGESVLEVRSSGQTDDGTLLLLDERPAHRPTLNEAMGAARPAIAANGFSGSNSDTSQTLDALQELGLTRRQSEVLWCLARGQSNSQIAARLHLSSHTVRHHIEAIFERLNVQSRSAAAHRAQQIIYPFSLD